MSEIQKSRNQGTRHTIILDAIRIMADKPRAVELGEMENRERGGDSQCRRQAQTTESLKLKLKPRRETLLRKPVFAMEPSHLVKIVKKKTK